MTWAGDTPEPSLEPYDDVPAQVIDDRTVYTVTLATTCGDIVLELEPALAPTAVNAFVALSQDGYYAGVPFHRTINGFMIQGGDPTGSGTGCVDDACTVRLPGYQFADELDATEALVTVNGGYPRGTVAMANAGPDTNGSQFFIVQAEPGYPLPPQYVAFGRVVAGMDVVDRIANGPVDGQIATEPAVILSTTVEPAA
jgi:cyclophilin family peptidyl-prolyl cis-trans isomerase